MFLRYNYNKYICEHDVFHQLKRFARRQKITVFSTRVVRMVFSLYILSSTSHKYLIMQYDRPDEGSEYDVHFH